MGRAPPTGTAGQRKGGDLTTVQETNIDKRQLMFDHSRCLFVYVADKLAVILERGGNGVIWGKYCV